MARIAARIKKKASLGIRIMPIGDAFSRQVRVARSFDNRFHPLICSQWSLAAQCEEL